MQLMLPSLHFYTLSQMVCVFVSGCVCVCVCVHMYVSTTVCVQDKVLPAALEVSHLFLSDHVDMLANKKQDNTVLS